MKFLPLGSITITEMSDHQMSIGVINRKILWGMSGNRCAFPGCNQELVAEKKDGCSIIGEECHIIAKERKGPRGNSLLNEEEKDNCSNLILLCPTHHTIIDKDPDEYTPEKLKKMKSDHEARVRRSLEDKSDFDDLYYESIVLYIDSALDFDHWDIWTSYLLSNNGPMCSEKTYSNIDRVRHYILNRVWYSRYPELEDAFKNLNCILNDLFEVFSEHAELKDNVYTTDKFYKLEPYNHEESDKLVVEYNAHLILMQNLVYEMTKAINHLCDLTRKYIDPSYRLDKGKLLLYDSCPEYKSGERYPGLKDFKKNLFQ